MPRRMILSSSIVSVFSRYWRGSPLSCTIELLGGSPRPVMLDFSDEYRLGFLLDSTWIFGGHGNVVADTQCSVKGIVSE